VKNAAMACMELGQCTTDLDPNMAVTHYADAMEFFERALECGNAKAKNWVDKLQNTYWDCTEKALELTVKLAAREMLSAVQTYASVIRTDDVKYMCLCTLLLRMCDVIKDHLDGDECDTALEYINKCHMIISETQQLTSREDNDDLVKLQQKIDALATRTKTLTAINTGEICDYTYIIG
jgi:hypothetical protein